MKFKKKLEKLSKYNTKFEIYDIADVEGTTYITFRLDILKCDIEYFQTKGLIFDYYDDEKKLFYFNFCNVNRGSTNKLQIR